MKNINALIDEINIAGLELLLLMPTAMIGVFPEPDMTNGGSIDASLIDLNDPYPKWIILVHTKDTGQLNEDCDSSDSGPVYKYTVDCFVPKHYPFRETQFDELAKQEHIAIVKDNNGIFRIIGCSRDLFDKKGVEFRWKYTSGAASKDRNGYKVTLTLQTSEKARPVTGMDTLAISSDFFTV